MNKREKGENTGLFITLEGPDGAGKSTQARMLQQRLQKWGKDVLLVREPGGTSIGEAIRELLLNPCHTEMTVACEVLLYSAARAQLVHEQIKPALNRGEVVLSDRFWDSTLVYQGLAGGENLDIIERISLWATGNLVPRLTLLLDLDARQGLLRVHGSKEGARPAGGDRVEQKELHFHHRVRSGFLELASREKGRFCIIPANETPQAVHEKIWEKVVPLLENEK